MSNPACHACKMNWKDCPGFPFYTAGDLQLYCSHQVLWICREFFDTDQNDNIILVMEQWPTEDKEASGYSLGIRVQSSVRSCAGFEKPMQEAGQIHSRVVRTNGDGVKLIQQVHRGRVWSDKLHRDREFSQDAKTALLYCCGKRGRQWEYRKWKSMWQNGQNVR